MISVVMETKVWYPGISLRIYHILLGKEVWATPAQLSLLAVVSWRTPGGALIVKAI